MRSAAIAFSAVFALGAVVLVAAGLGQRSSLVYTLGVYPATVAADIDPGDRACQAPVRVPRGAAFDRVGFLVGTYDRAGPELRVQVFEDETGRRLGSGTLAGGYEDLDRTQEHVVPVGRVQTDEALRLCLVNEGRTRAGVIGQVGIASPPTSGTFNGKPIESDLTLNLRSGERSLLAWLPDIADRASRFRASWVTPLTYLLLAVGILVVAPLLLARGIARAAAADDG
jgi:hypothetical protein